jgi:hypothetical protein
MTVTCFLLLSVWYRIGILIINFCAFRYLCSGFRCFLVRSRILESVIQVMGPNSYSNLSLSRKDVRCSWIVKWLHHSRLLWFVLIFEVIFWINIYIFHRFGIRKGKDPDPNNMRLDRETGRYGTLSILSVTVPLYWNTTHEIKVPTYNVLRTRYRSCMEHGLWVTSNSDTCWYGGYRNLLDSLEKNLGWCFIVQNWPWGLPIFYACRIRPSTAATGRCSSPRCLSASFSHIFKEINVVNFESKSRSF